MQSATPSTTRSSPLVIGTRGSPLALAQAEEVRDRLAAHGMPAERIALEVIRTTGDAIRDRPLTDAGGKGLFTKEIEEALIAGAIDLAVHSAKDMATFLPTGLRIAAVLEREDPRDVFISAKAKTLDGLPRGACVGTASLRRQALVKRLRGDLHVVPMRGNVETRLRKLAAGEVDAIVLALAVVRAVNHDETAAALTAERTFLAVLEGSCRTPIAGYAAVASGRLAFRGLIAKPDGSDVIETQRYGAVIDAVRLGAEAGRELKQRAGAGFFAAV